MDSLLAFAATLLSLRLAGRLLDRWRDRRGPELLAWGVSLASFAVASAALAWGAAAGWSSPAFRVYYLCGGLLTAPLLGAGSLLRAGKRWAAPVAIAYAGLATGLALAAPVHGSFGAETIPEAQKHLEFFPVRLVAVLGNSLGTVAVLAVAATTFRRRPLGNGLIVAGVAVAALGSALFGLGIAGTAASLALAAGLLYAGFVARR
ncbi:MAG TPA: hypothetical protein VLB86_09235 [Gaiellaceae bacterium]|nr:hypothetical protein [Gaiellaceae bacterium]